MYNYYLSNHPFQLARRYAYGYGRSMNATLPIQLSENEDEYILTAVVAGLKAEDLNIQVLEDTVTISGSYPVTEGEILVNELPAGEFSRSMRFPVELDAEKTEASIENGILTLKVAKAEVVKPKSIQIKVS